MLVILRGHNWFILSLCYSVLLPRIQTSLFEKPEIVFYKRKRIIWAYSFMEKGDRF